MNDDTPCKRLAVAHLDDGFIRKPLWQEVHIGDTLRDLFFATRNFNTLKDENDHINIADFYDDAKPPLPLDLELLEALPSEVDLHKQIYGIENYHLNRTESEARHRAEQTRDEWLADLRAFTPAGSFTLTNCCSTWATVGVGAGVSVGARVGASTAGWVGAMVNVAVGAPVDATLPDAFTGVAGVLFASAMEPAGGVAVRTPARVRPIQAI